MGAALVAVAEMTNSFAVVTVISTLFVMVVFILRLQGEDMLQASGVQRPSIPPKPIPMVAVRNPFALSLVKKIECSLNGVYCEISSQIPVLFQVFWGVEVMDLNKLLQLEWHLLKQCLTENTLFNQTVVCKEELQSFDACENREISLQPVVDLSSKLGSAPRTKYPLVIVMVEKECERSDEDEDENVNEYVQRVVAMISIIHVKDNIMKDESYIYAQYLKQNSGQIVTLKPLYVSSSDEPDMSKDCPEVSSNCVVCQCESITRALLPCRHACICQNCFSKVDKCPMCRSHIANYFCIKEETHLAIQNPSVNLAELNWMQKFEFYLGKMNEYFGFR